MPSGSKLFLIGADAHQWRGQRLENVDGRADHRAPAPASHGRRAGGARRGSRQHRRRLARNREPDEAAAPIVEPACPRDRAGDRGGRLRSARRRSGGAETPRQREQRGRHRAHPRQSSSEAKTRQQLRRATWRFSSRASSALPIIDRGGEILQRSSVRAPSPPIRPADARRRGTRGEPRAAESSATAAVANRARPVWRRSG